MADFTAIGTIIASIGGTLAAIAKDRSDRTAITKDLAELKSQVHELVDAVDRIKQRVRGQGPDPAIADLQKQVTSLALRVDEQHDKFARRLDERDSQWLSLQRELGSIGAKIEILLQQK